MALATYVNNRYKLLMVEKAVDLHAATLVGILMRSNFAQVIPYDVANYSKRENVSGNSGAIALTWSNTPATITCAATNFWTSGFAPGNYITTDAADAANQGPFLVSSIDTTGPGQWMIVTDLTGADPTLSAGGPEAGRTITFEDQLAAAGGYAQDSVGVGIPGSVVLDQSGNKAYVDWDPIYFGNILMGDIAATAGMIIYDDDAPDDEIVGFLDFGSDQSSTWPDYLQITGLRFQIV